MKHENYKELLELNVLGELSKQEELELENHLFECDECSQEYANIKKLYSVVLSERPSTPTEANLMNARKRLFNTINSESLNVATQVKSNISWYNIFSNNYGVAFGSVALILLGFFVGYMLFSNPSPNLLTENSLNLDKIDRGDVKIADVNFPDKFSENGEFEFKLNDEKLSSYKGSLDDVTVQKLLASAINETENAGFKIKTANSFSKLLPNNFMPDSKIKDAFISSLKTDKNPGVRKSALQALISFQYDDKIRDVLIFVLENDDNASIRMGAINTLLAMNLGPISIDKNMMYKLNQDISKEENEVIKYKTAKLLIGGK
jgi:Putative zinc-finger